MSYRNPPHHFAPPDNRHALQDRRFQGIPSIAASASGRLWAVWYAGVTPKEDENNYVVVSTSADLGVNWQEVLVIDPDGAGPVRAFDPEAWIDPLGRLWIFWAQSVGHDGSIAGVWSSMHGNPDSADASWTAPHRLTDGVMMCKPTVLSTGEWLLPASTWKGTDNSGKVVVSTDEGQTWSVRGGCNVPRQVRSYDEHMLVERRDGSLWMLVRTEYGIGESESSDRGQAWGPVTKSAVEHPSSRFFVRRLTSGRILLVKNGPISTRSGRSHMSGYLSDDDGASWIGALLLDEREGVSYPDGQQLADGTVCIVYDRSRIENGEINMVYFSEGDILARQNQSLEPHRRKIVSSFTDSQ